MHAQLSIGAIFYPTFLRTLPQVEPGPSSRAGPSPNSVSKPCLFVHLILLSRRKSIWIPPGKNTNTEYMHINHNHAHLQKISYQYWFLVFLDKVTAHRCLYSQPDTYTNNLLFNIHVPYLVSGWCMCNCDRLT